MLKFLAAAAILAGAAIAPAKAEAPFCSLGTGGTESCSLFTLEQCRYSLRGMANTGTCYRNRSFGR